MVPNADLKPIFGKKEEHKPKLFWSGYLPLGWVSSTWKGGGQKVWYVPRNPQKKWGGVAQDFCRDILGVIGKFEKTIFMFNFRSQVNGNAIQILKQEFLGYVVCFLGVRAMQHAIALPHKIKRQKGSPREKLRTPPPLLESSLSEVKSIIWFYFALKATCKVQESTSSSSRKNLKIASENNLSFLA